MDLNRIKCVISPPFGHYLKFFSWATPIRGTFTIKRRKGIIKNALKTFRYSLKRNGWINKMGLVNKGIKSQIPFNPEHIYSITAFNDEDWEELYDIIPSNIVLEINLSCPNSNEINISRGVLLRFSEKYNLIVKVSSNNFYETLDQVNFAHSCRVRAFHVGNTVKIPEGALSGKKIQKISLQIIKFIRRNIPDAIIIGGGGIYSKEDVIAYRNAGANIFSLATIWMTPWKVREVKKEIFKK